MKKAVSFFSGSLVGLLFIAQNAFAVCTLNGEVVPCDQIPKWPFALMMLFFLLMMLFLAFWIWMIVDAVQNEKDNDLLVWLLILIFLGFIGAIIYYFVRKRKRKKLQEEKKTSQDDNSSQQESK